MSVSELHTYAAQIDAPTPEPACGWLEFDAKLDAHAAELERDATEASSPIFALTANHSTSRHGEDG